jgi:two-component system nitrogen regulation response regulator GlnG
MEANALLSSGQTDVWDILSRKFEAKLIQTALSHTKGRRIEAALKLGIGRNTSHQKNARAWTGRLVLCQSKVISV